MSVATPVLAPRTQSFSDTGTSPATIGFSPGVPSLEPANLTTPTRTMVIKSAAPTHIAMLLAEISFDSIPLVKFQVVRFGADCPETTVNIKYLIIINLLMPFKPHYVR